jgi:predicted nucleic-acid-binding protein
VSPKRYRVDANVLLRFLTGEPEDMAARSARLMQRAEQGEVLLVLSMLVVAEMVWVLESVYRHSYRDIAGALIPLLRADGVETEDHDLIVAAIELARDKNVDFADAILALAAAHRQETVCTFDQSDFQKLPAAWALPG